MKDKMGPVIAQADLRKTTTPTKRPDLITVTLSEPLQKTAISGDQLFHYLVEGSLVTDMPHDRSLDWRAEDVLRISYSPNMLKRPTIGDSIRINAESGLLGLIVDKAGNKASNNNPWRVLRGTPVIQITTPGIATYNPNQSWKDSVFVDPMFFDKGVNVDSVATLLGLSGAIFQFNFNDSSQTPEERSTIKIGYELSIYDQLGSFVASTRAKSFGCADMQTRANGSTSLAQACNPAAFGATRTVGVLLPWNMRSDAGRLVGTGPYLIRAKVSVKQGAKTLLKEAELEQMIGVARQK
jgi:hypothetical protein